MLTAGPPGEPAPGAAGEAGGDVGGEIGGLAGAVAPCGYAAVRATRLMMERRVNCMMIVVE